MKLFRGGFLLGTFGHEKGILKLTHTRWRRGIPSAMRLFRVILEWTIPFQTCIGPQSEPRRLNVHDRKLFGVGKKEIHSSICRINTYSDPGSKLLEDVGQTNWKTLSSVASGVLKKKEGWEGNRCLTVVSPGQNGFKH